MPSVSIWMIRLSLVYLLITTVSGTVLFLNEQLTWNSTWLMHRSIHMEMGMTGWLMQFVMGVAYWAFPKLLEGNPRGCTKSAWMVLVLINVAILLLVISDAVIWAGLIGSIVLITAIGLYTHLMWNRIISYRNHDNRQMLGDSG